jgi:hypothetical protein
VSQIISMQEVALNFFNRYSGFKFDRYSSYSTHLSRIHSGEVKTHLSHVEIIERENKSLVGDELNARREEMKKNLLLLAAPQQFILSAIHMPFPIYSSNGCPSRFSSLDLFEDGQIIQNIIQNEWACFGRNSLTADSIETMHSSNCFFNPHLELNARNAPFMRVPLFSSILRILNEGPETWKRYEKKDFEEGDGNISAVARFISKDYNTDTTIASQIALRLKQALFP